MHANMLRTLAISIIAIAAIGCGKEAEPAGDTTSAKAAEAKPAAAEKPAEDANADEGASDEGKSKKKKTEDTGAPVRKAKDNLTAPDTVFMYSFKDSDAKDKAEKACEEKAKGDQAKQAACMDSAAKRFGADGYHFGQDDSGKWYWEVVKVKNGVITYLHKVPIEFGKETDTTIEVKVVGKDEAKGAKGSLPNEVTFEVPNGYQIIRTDSEEGKQVFESKLGLLGDQSKRKR